MKPTRNKSYEEGLDAGFKSGYEVGFEKAKEMAANIAGSRFELRPTFINSVITQTIVTAIKVMKLPKAMK